MSVELLLLLQNLCNAAQGLFAVDNAGGIDRVVDDDRLGFFVDLFLKFNEIRLEIHRIRRYNHQLAVIVADIRTILYKVRCKGNDLLSWI